jgi:hypothetical protein
MPLTPSSNRVRTCQGGYEGRYGSSASSRSRVWAAFVGEEHVTQPHAHLCTHHPVRKLSEGVCLKEPNPGPTRASVSLIIMLAIARHVHVSSRAW